MSFSTRTFCVSGLTIECEWREGPTKTWIKIANKRVRNLEFSRGKIVSGELCASSWRPLTTQEIAYLNEELDILDRLNLLDEERATVLARQRAGLDAEAAQRDAILRAQSAEQGRIQREMSTLAQRINPAVSGARFGAEMSRLGSALGAVGAKYGAQLAALNGAAAREAGQELQKIGAKELELVQALILAMKQHLFDGLTEDELLPRSSGLKGRASLHGGKFSTQDISGDLFL